MVSLMQTMNGAMDEKKHVYFSDEIVIQEYALEIGDNPACTSGVPIQLGWKVESRTVRNFQLFDYLHESNRKFQRRDDLILSAKERSTMLLGAGFSAEDVTDALNMVQEIKESRNQTLRAQGWDQVFILLLNRTGHLDASKILSKTHLNHADQESEHSNGLWKSAGKKLRKILHPKPQTKTARSA